MHSNLWLGRITLLALCACFAGCTTYHSPKKLSAEERVVIANAGLSDLMVGIVVDQQTGSDFESEERVRLLQRTHLFKEIDYVENLTGKPDLLLRSEPNGFRPGCVTGPGSVIILTLGLVPVKLPHDTSTDFEIMSPDGAQITTIRYQSKQSLWWGSAISVLALSPEWTLGEPDEERHVLRLAFALASRRDEIRALLQH